jgi:hypothetical protein
MAKAKKRIALRKKSSKRGKASAKPARKLAKNATTKKAKSKVQRARVGTKKSPAKKKRPPETIERKPVAEVPVSTVESTIIDVIEQPSPDVVAVTEYESVETTTYTAGGEPESGEGVGPAGTSSTFQVQGERPGHEAEEAA